MAKGRKITKIASSVKPEKPARKKFAVPPVKLACLECRQSRTRCDGKTECSNCLNRNKTCVYTASKRGGSRIRRRKLSIDEEKSLSTNNSELNHCALSILPELDEVAASFSGPLQLVAPGGGLTQLDFSSDDSLFIFDSVFSGQGDSLDSGYETSEVSATLSEVDHPKEYIRVYQTDEDILNAYYVYIHPYFPVLPPPQPQQVIDNPDYGVRRAPDAIFSSRTNPDFEPSTPLSLAISASLSLIPHPDDPNPSGLHSVRLRREQAQAFAQSAFESIEIESELIESGIEPGEALSSDPAPLIRNPFHPELPLENESIVALLMLSTYEYAQRGNIAKMRNRAGQALNAALNLGLHSKGNEEGYHAEANRRTWWMTYILVCQGAILSNSTPPMLLNDRRFTTAGPTYMGDPGAWPVFLQSQQAITSSTQFVINLDATLKLGTNPMAIWDRMLELESFMEPLINQADTWSLSTNPQPPLDSLEVVVGQALRGMARIKLNRIKLHRYCAFSDVPVFSKKHCDLRSSSEVSSPGPGTGTPSAPNCGCSNTFHNLPTAADLSSPISTVSSPSMNCALLPYSSKYSAKMCLKSAMNIAHSFRTLPYPQPIRPNDPLSFFPEMRIDSNAPRMIPVFACCAMQSSYALIMLSYKTKAMGFVGDTREESAMKLLGQLSEGLQMILGAIKNYSIAYEALGGMSGMFCLLNLISEAMLMMTFRTNRGCGAIY
ncbi:uncharacterized protein LY89DRAFT_661403 [Mollisia scopiformis]|uniref:Zn(2)-C6 fungal-type domain-containing protein n=1 Tax=Mollisia scopiformis TaxID=149040 RepID=A0A132B349_MOLSC|nr:uncharacterized protein LY89DRAFT_661403 [Mollisia scopiformis]KUJ06822.1 hypothetical protein LY89DRAFT_661403 [Mollisia scopiformis]